ncbi:MBL fold metallo-hydrolase [Arthrobacter sp. MYb227]|uniref:MBL fold metallo-hydrolase n=1 Tax=Arthrobacter sp. MYb227 TaxID=1848601 RepID=UPI000CFD4BD4|nr:MBL fold metallo-hydrolase [Arthrobacter sp. MYb227]PQZ96208.1 MBL fold metallo-hydrolase [Arthrobacter sp. MYb227]
MIPFQEQRFEGATLPADLVWEALPDDCWRLRSPGFEMNSGLIVGTRSSLLVDTGSGPREAAAIHRAVRRITDTHLIIANTHAHGDHFLGNDYFRAQGVTDFYAGTLAIEHMEQTESQQRELVASIEPEMAAGEGECTRLHIPEHRVGSAPVRINLGDKFVTLQQLGNAHSPGDISVHTGRVLFAGDVIEQGGPPNFEDSIPLRWVAVLDELVTGEALDTVYVPGHGGTVDRDFVLHQRDQIREAITTCRKIAAVQKPGSEPTDHELRVLPFGPVESRNLYQRVHAT